MTDSRQPTTFATLPGCDMQHHVFDEYRDTPLWRAVAAAVRELEATHEIAVATAPDYVIGYVCQELEAKKVLSPGALVADRLP